MEKKQLINKLEDIEWEDFDYYKITFPTTRRTTRVTTRKILDLLNKNPKYTRKKIGELLGISEDGVKYHLKKLKREGKIQRMGNYWKVK